MQASHIGYDPETKEFGIYRRLHTTDERCSTSCGYLHNVTSWYLNEYEFAQQNILLHNIDGKKIIIIDSHLLREDRSMIMDYIASRSEERAVLHKPAAEA